MLWFEKFYWFVSSNGWLVISGRDSHQNELLVKRYMKTGDLYMHSDYGGAASTIIKGPPKAGPAPTTTLEEAAIFTVCRSKAWDTKIISSAWWVYHDQVSKSAPTGEYLPTGSFMIRGKRNFLHPNRMEMGFTFLYRLDQESFLRKLEHKKELMAEIKEEEQSTELKREASNFEEEDEYAIIDLEAEARKAREQVAYFLFRKKKNMRKEEINSKTVPRDNRPLKRPKNLNQKSNRIQKTQMIVMKIKSRSTQNRTRKTTKRKMEKKQINKRNRFRSIRIETRRRLKNWKNIWSNRTKMNDKLS
jgi:hypothetical protein